MICDGSSSVGRVVDGGRKSQSHDLDRNVFATDGSTIHNMYIELNDDVVTAATSQSFSLWHVGNYQLYSGRHK